MFKERILFDSFGQSSGGFGGCISQDAELDCAEVCDCITVTSSDGSISVAKNGCDIDIVGASAETVTTLVNNGNGTYTYTNEDGVATIIDVNEIDMDINAINITGSVLTFTAEDGTDTVVDICAIVAGNCNTSLVANPDGSLTFTDNGGNTNVIPAGSGNTSVVTDTNTNTSVQTIATHDDGSGTVVNIEETITSLSELDNGDDTTTITYTREDGNTDDVTYCNKNIKSFVDEDGRESTEASCNQLTLHRTLHTTGNLHGGSVGSDDLMVSGEDTDQSAVLGVSTRHDVGVYVSLNGTNTGQRSAVIGSANATNGGADSIVSGNGSDNTGNQSIQGGRQGDNSGPRSLQTGDGNTNSGDSVSQSGINDTNTGDGVSQGGINNVNNGNYVLQNGSNCRNENNRVLQGGTTCINEINGGSSIQWGQEHYNSGFASSQSGGRNNRNEVEYSHMGGGFENDILDLGLGDHANVINGGHEHNIDGQADAAIQAGEDNSITSDGSGVAYGNTIHGGIRCTINTSASNNNNGIYSSQDVVIPAGFSKATAISMDGTNGGTIVRNDQLHVDNLYINLVNTGRVYIDDATAGAGGLVQGEIYGDNAGFVRYKL